MARSKLVPPVLREEHVPRERLVSRIIGSSVPLVFISGPAGAGKSVVMAQCHAQSGPSAWLSLDRMDNDPVQLWWALIDCVRDVIPEFGETYRHRLTTAGTAVIDEVIAAVTNELAERRSALRIFLDDLHLIDDAGCLQSLHRFISQLPNGVGVVAASRGTPPIPVARLRVEGELLEIDAASLAMSLEEAEALFARIEPRLDRELIEVLVARSEGWAAGLQLAGMAMAQADDVVAFVTSFGGDDRAIADYLFTEVLEQRPAEERRFMLETSILRRLSGDVCDAVTGRPGSAEHLRSIQRSNAFLIPLDRVGTWYRYHHLFADLLVHRLQAEHPGSVQDLHAGAFVWFRDNGHADDAVHHALAAGRRTDAADLICAHWYGLLNSGRLHMAKALVELFEPDEIMGYQPLANAAAYIYAIGGMYRQARRYLDAAEHGTFEGPAPDGAASMESSLALTRGSLALDGVERALVDAMTAYALEPANGQWRPLAALAVGCMLVIKGDLDRSVPFFEEASRAPDAAVRAYALAEVAHGHLATGRTDRAVAIAEEACDLVRHLGLEDTISAAAAFAAAAQANLAHGDPTRARAALAAAAQPMDSVVGQAFPLDAMRVHVLLAEAALELGEYETARQYTNRATRIATTVSDIGRLGEALFRLRRRWRDDATDGGGSSPEVSPFTERELEVLALLSVGMTTREIGAELFLSKNTIKTYLRRVYRKLGASSRADAVERAGQMGLLSDHPPGSGHD